MVDSQYLVALALIEQKGSRAMPLGGKSIKYKSSDIDSPGLEGEGLVLELLLRVFQRSDEVPLRRAAGDKSLLLINISMDLMQSHIPLLKSEWIDTGDTKTFLLKLIKLCTSIWSFNFNREDGLHFVPIY